MTITSPSKLIIGRIKFGSTSINSTYGVTSSVYYGYPNSFDVVIEIDPQYHSDPTSLTPYTYDTNDIIVGDWFGLTNGKIYRVKSIVSVIDSKNIQLIIEDKGLFNLISDYAQLGNNMPEEQQYGVFVEIGGDGLPIYNPITVQSAQLPFQPYWISDLVSRFRYRNYLTDYYQVDPDDNNYLSFNVGDFVYLDINGRFEKVTDLNKSSYFQKIFGIVSSVEDDGFMYVRPFGRIISNLPNLPGVTGSLIYFDPNGFNSLTDVKPSSYILPTYIKISNNTGLLLNNHPSYESGGGMTGATGFGYQGPQGYDGLQGNQGFQGLQGHQGWQGFQGLMGNQGTQGNIGSGFNTIINPGNNRLLTSNGDTQSAYAESNLIYDGNTLTIGFVTGSTGSILNVNGSSGSIFNVYDNLNGPILNVGYILGTPIFQVNSNGSIYISSVNHSSLTSSGIVYYIDKSSGSSAFFDYRVLNTIGSQRSGTVMATWNDTNVAYTDTSTSDLLSSTNGIEFEVSISASNVLLSTMITSGTWSIKVGSRII